MNAVRRQEVAEMLRDWKEEVDLRAAGAICPMPNCGALVISYEPGDGGNEVQRKSAANWDFVCSECGTEFSAPAGDLLFHSVPREWLYSGVCRA